MFGPMFVLGFEGYKIPHWKDNLKTQDFIDHIDALPSNDMPEVFGLHRNADIT